MDVITLNYQNLVIMNIFQKPELFKYPLAEKNAGFNKSAAIQNKPTYTKITRNDGIMSRAPHEGQIVALLPYSTADRGIYIS